MRFGNIPIGLFQYGLNLGLFYGILVANLDICEIGLGDCCIIAPFVPPEIKQIFLPVRVTDGVLAYGILLKQVFLVTKEPQERLKKKQIICL